MGGGGISTVVRGAAAIHQVANLGKIGESICAAVGLVVREMGL